MLSIVSIITVIGVILFFFWSRGKINELYEKMAILRDEIENLKRKQNEQKRDIESEIQKSREESEELRPQKETEISEPEPKLPEPRKKETFYLGMPNAKGFLKEETQRAGYFIAQESGSNKAFFIFVNDQAKLNVIFKNDMEGKFYKVEKGIALPGKILLKQTEGTLGKKGDFWAVLKPITIELGN